MTTRARISARRQLSGLPVSVMTRSPTTLSPMLRPELDQNTVSTVTRITNRAVPLHTAPGSGKTMGSFVMR